MSGKSGGLMSKTGAIYKGKGKQGRFRLAGSL